jgi:penicillin-binding protein 1A
MKYSKNVVSVLTENTIGIDTGISYGEKFGLKYNKDYTGIATLALGQFRNDPANPDGGNTYILASAFGVFGNNGEYTTPNLYSKVTDSNGKVLLETEVTNKEIFSKQTAYILYDMLKGSRSITGPAAQWGDMPVAGKTGTTTNSKDLWFSGVTPYLSGSVWLGYYDSSKTVGSNSNLAAKVWGQIMSKAHEGLEVTDLEQPEGIIQVAVCQDSGNLPTDLCSNDPRGTRVYHELFISGTEPTTLCETHVKAKINSSNNKLATESTPADLSTEGIFVKKDYPNEATYDYKYVLPIELDDTVSVPAPDPVPTVDDKKTTDTNTKTQ